MEIIENPDTRGIVNRKAGKEVSPQIHLVECSSTEIKQRMFDWDKILWNEEFIKKFMEEGYIRYAISE